MSPPKPIVLITGANRGIGHELARTLARDQNFHVLLGSRNPTSGADAVSQLHSEGLSSITHIPIDISSDSSILAAAALIKNEYGHIDVLVSNAGIMLPHSADQSLATKRQSFRDSFDTNVAGVAVLIDAFIPLLEKAGVPRMVFLGTTLGSIAQRVDREHVWEWVDAVSYRCSKAALSMLAMQYAVRYRDKGWKVNIVCPGYVKTGMVNFNGTVTTEEAMPHIVRLCTLGEDGETGTFTDADGTVPW